MKKRVMSLLLVMLMVFALLPAAAMATNTPAPKDENNVYLAKSYDPASGMITLEAYTKGEVTVTPTEKAVPCDIVLVLDVSGSMYDNMSQAGYSELSSRQYSYNTLNGYTNYYYFDGTDYNQVHAIVNYEGWGWFSTHYTYAYFDKDGVRYYLKGTQVIQASSTADPTYDGSSGTKPTDVNGNTIEPTENDSGTIWTGVLYTYSTQMRKYVAMKNAVKAFIDNVQKNAEENDVDHRISIVKFAGDSLNTIGNSTYNRSGYTDHNSQIMIGLTSVDENAETLSNTVNAIAELDDGATAADYGMNLAEKSLSGEYGTTAARSDTNKVVVMFTDGQPNHGSGFNTTVADTAVQTSSALKAAGVKVYTVGVFSGLSNNDQIQVNRYMNAVSSNCQNATSYTAGGTDIGGYYMTASSPAELSSIFEKIAQDEISGGSLTELDAQSYVIDKMSEYFQLDGVSSADTSKVEIYTADCTGDGVFADPVRKNGLTVDVLNGDTVRVTGYDFSENWVGYNASTGKYRGQKLIIKFPVQPKAGYSGTVPTNDETSGIYDKDGKAALTFPEPDYTPNYVPKIIDFNAKMVLAANVGELGNQTKLNGLFELNKGVLTYQLLPEEQLGDHSASLVMKGVDSAMTFTSNVWTQYAAIPANNIYFDDALLNTQVAVADGAGYNVGVTTDAAEAVTAINDRDVLVYTFTGTGIDVYCTTNADGGYVQAGLMTGDAAEAENLVYFESADGHYYKSGDNYVRIDKEHPAPAGATLYDTSLIAVRNYSVTPEGKDRYNVPTVSYTGLPYGTYTIRIKAVDNANYKLDGIRIYNAMANDETVYAGTDEANAHFYNLREALVNDGQDVTVQKQDESSVMKTYLAGTASEQLPGVLFIDDADSVKLEKTIKTVYEDGSYSYEMDENGQRKMELVYKDAFSAYVANGPKNEIYLAKGQGIAFKIADSALGDKYWLGLSVPDEGSTSAVVAVNGKAVEPTISSAVDMYYEITPRTDGTVVIVNNGDAMVAVTNLKVTSKLPGDKSASPFALLSADTLDLVADATAVESQQSPVDQNLKDIFQQLISNFVRILFNNIARMFGK